MKRVLMPVREEWERTIEQQGMAYYLEEGKPYWGEGTAYGFSLSEIDEIEAATQDLHGMCLAAVDYVITNKLYDRFKIPEAFRDSVEHSWRHAYPYIFGRFDLSYDGKNPPKMLEYNAETPTSLPEAAIVQWYWLEDMKAAGHLPVEASQYNIIHESLIAAWKQVAEQVAMPDPLYFTCPYCIEETCVTNIEDYQNLQYMREVCEAAGIKTKDIDIAQIGWNGVDFVDLENKPIRAMFKYYPWEYMVKEAFGSHISKTKIGIIEPQWKMILTNKALLPVLWKMYPGHPNLLPAFHEEGKIIGDYVKKPLLSREGCNVTVVKDGQHIHTGGGYGAEGYIYQAFAPLASFDGHHPVIGSWVTSEQPQPETELKRYPRGGRACGMGIREDTGLVTMNKSRFVPHYFVP